MVHSMTPLSPRGHIASIRTETAAAVVARVRAKIDMGRMDTVTSFVTKSLSTLSDRYFDGKGGSIARRVA